MFNIANQLSLACYFKFEFWGIPKFGKVDPNLELECKELACIQKISI